MTISPTKDLVPRDLGEGGVGLGADGDDTKQIRRVLDMVLDKLDLNDIKVLHRLFDHADADVALVATTATIDLGDALPEGAFVLATRSAVTEDFANAGDTATYTADIGTGSDDDAYTPTALDIDGGVADLGAQLVLLPASGVQVKVKFTSSANLSTAAAGKLDTYVWYIVPEVAEG